MRVMVPERMRISADRFEKMIETGVLTKYDRVELIDGDMVNEPKTNPPHSAVMARLNELLVLAAAGSAMVSPEGSVRLGDFSIPQPDLMLLKRRADYYSGRRPTAADVLLLVEISDSSLAYDQSIKRALYARHGIRSTGSPMCVASASTSTASRPRMATRERWNAPPATSFRRGRSRPFKSKWRLFSVERDHEAPVMNANLKPVHPSADAERSARVDLAACYRLADRFGLNEGIDNHMTMLVPGCSDRFLLAPFGMHWSEVKAE